jgi:hypothetical protein
MQQQHRMPYAAAAPYAVCSSSTVCRMLGGAPYAAAAPYAVCYPPSSHACYTVARYEEEVGTYAYRCYLGGGVGMLRLPQGRCAYIRMY